MDEAQVPGMDAEQRLSEWIDTYSDAIWRVCFLYLSDRSLAEDALQETWLKVWKSLKRGERLPENDKAWLMRIAVNVCRDQMRMAWFRHVDRRKAAEDIPEKADPGVTADRTLTMIVMSMPIRYRQVVLLYHYQGLTLKETGEVLGLSLSAVNRRLKKAEAILRDEWTGGEEI